MIGEHSGIHNFTVGQRKGLGVATGSPLYVIQINGADKRVIVGGDERLYSRTLRARRVNHERADHGRHEAQARLGEDSSPPRTRSGLA